MRKHSVLLYLMTVLLLTVSVGAMGVAAAQTQSGRYLFLTEDINQPVPGTNHTAEDFTDLGIELFDSWAALQAAMTDDVCMVGTLGLTDPEAEMWLRNPNNTARIATYQLDLDSGASRLALMGSGISRGSWRFDFFWSDLSQYTCRSVARRVVEAAAREVELEALYASQAPQPTGYGGVFVVMDLEDPVPGTPYTADDFTAANIRLLTPNDALITALSNDICMVGGYPETMELRLLSTPLKNQLTETNVNVLIMDPDIEFFFHGHAHSYFRLSHRGLVREIPSMRNEDGTWRSIPSIMEEIGCPTEPPPMEPPPMEPPPMEPPPMEPPQAEVPTGREYRVITGEELLMILAATLGAESPAAIIEEVLNSFRADGWEPMVELDEVLLIFQRPAAR